MLGPRTRRRHVAEQNTVLNSMVAVNRLPQELLAEIFLSGNAEYESGRSGAGYLAIITSICATWRATAIETPMLWTNIVYPSTTRHASEVVYRMIKTFLLRSKGASINLHLDLSGRETVNKNKIMELIKPHISRCRTITLRFSYSSQTSSILPFAGQMTRLVELDVDGWHGSGSLPRPLFTDDNDSPLRILRLGGDASGMLSDVPSGALRHVALRFNGHKWVETMTFVSRCMLAEDLSLKLCVLPTGSGGIPRPSVLHPFTLPRLRRLTIVDELALDFTRYISTPNLEELIILSVSWITEPDRPLTPVNSSGLRTLTLSHFAGPQTFRVSTVRPIFQAHPSITKLRIIDSRNHSVITALLLGVGETDSHESLSQPSEGSLLPILAFLELHKAPTRV